MIETYEYKRNQYCHRILELLYKNASPEIRESTYKQLTEGEQGKLYATDYFPSIILDKLIEQLNQSDTFVQECCEYLCFNSHIEIAERTVRQIMTKIRFTKAGVIAFKTDFYLKANKQQDQIDKLHKSTISNNKLTPIIAVVTFLVALTTLLKDCTCAQQNKSKLLSNKDTINIKLVPSDTQSVKMVESHQNTSNTTSSTLTKQDSLTKTIQ